MNQYWYLGGLKMNVIQQILIQIAILEAKIRLKHSVFCILLAFLTKVKIIIHFLAIKLIIKLILSSL
jgi:hypothetical protein